VRRRREGGQGGLREALRGGVDNGGKTKGVVERPSPRERREEQATHKGEDPVRQGKKSKRVDRIKKRAQGELGRDVASETEEKIKGGRCSKSSGGRERCPQLTNFRETGQIWTPGAKD